MRAPKLINITKPANSRDYFFRPEDAGCLLSESESLRRIRAWTRAMFHEAKFYKPRRKPYPYYKGY